MMRATLPLLVLLAACQPAAAPEPEASERATLDPLEAGPASIVGDYRVAGIDNEALDIGEAIAVSITATTISYEPTCLGYSWDYEYSQGTLAAERTPGVGPEIDENGSVASCLVAVPPEFDRVANAFADADRVFTTPENGLLFSGGRHSVTLFSQ